MAKLQEIENALRTINETVFQELCDSFLALRNSNYSAFARTGSQRGKQKTVSGTPDTLILLPNGKYILVEHSTNITLRLTKIKEDIQKCLNPDKTDVPIKLIDEIIVCLNFELSTEEIQELNELVRTLRIKLTIYALDSLSIELHLNHRDLVHTYLGFSLDTGQIVSIGQFVKEYNRAAQGIASHLDNTFLHREKELEQINALLRESDFIILTGAPGVGKTRLGIEAIRLYLKENLDCACFCVSYKHHTLLEDLFQSLDSKKNYVLFVDDANRIDAFSQITGYYKAFRTGTLKIVITVRDYAFGEIGLLCHEFSPSKLEIEKLNDKEIEGIIKAPPISIGNGRYYDPILRIADGNPRLAIMAAYLAKKEQKIESLSDVSELFDSYFSTFIKDEGEFADAESLKCLGLISFFYTIPFKNKSVTNDILKNFGISFDKFVDAIDRLEKLELVEIQFEHVKVSEQNLATYFFYKCFIKNNLLSFQTLLENYFFQNQSRFRDTVIPANNTFGPNRVMEKLRPYLVTFWNKLKLNQQEAYQFLETFYFYLVEEATTFIYEEIVTLPLADNPNFVFSDSKNDPFPREEKLLSILKEFFHSPEPKQYLELAFEYVKRKPELYSILLKTIREKFTFDDDDYRHRFLRHIALFELFQEKFRQEDTVYIAAFFEIAKTFLAYNFRGARGGRKMTIIMYEFNLTDDEGVLTFREAIWQVLLEQFEHYPSKSLEVLNSFAEGGIPDESKLLMQSDLIKLTEIIDRHLDVNDFLHCLFIQNLQFWLKRNKVNHEIIKGLARRFRNSVYEIYTKLSWDRFIESEKYDSMPYSDFERLKEDEIRSNFRFGSKEDAKSFFTEFVYLRNVVENKWNFNRALEFVIDENCKEDFSLGLYFLELVMDSDNSIDYLPWLIFRNNLNKTDRIRSIKFLISSHQFKSKSQWLLSFYGNLDHNLITLNDSHEALASIKSIDESLRLTLETFEQYLKVDSNFFEKVLKIVKEVNDSDRVKLRLWEDVYYKYFAYLGEDNKLLEDSYLQQIELEQHYDFESKGFKNILLKDVKFLSRYFDRKSKKDRFGLGYDERKLHFVWEIEGIESQLISIYDGMADDKFAHGLFGERHTVFFRNIEPEYELKADAFILSYTKANIRDVNKVNMMVDIARTVRRNIYDDIVLLYLSFNQEVADFKKIWWRGNGGSYSGHVIIGDIEASEWKSIQRIVEKSDQGIKLIPIKRYLNDMVESCLRQGDWERERKFLERGW
jgi:uncharacterized protein YlzI (FlbEa/FlbD family)